VPDDLIADGVERRLDPRYILHQQKIGWILAAVLSGVSFLALLITWASLDFSLVAAPLLTAGWALFCVALAWRAHRWPGIEYRHAAYRVDDRGIEIRRGVVWRRLISVPRSRVQHTDVSQGPLERTHGLGTLIIYTAGTDHARVDLPGLDHAAALRIRAHLLPQGDGDAV
jgi:membrane protein YdbS with pleckstrin-like domain